MTMLPPLTVDDLVRVDRRSRESEPGFGVLTSARGHLPLVAMDVSARLTGLVSSVSIRQTFRNCLSVAIEATYIFPLPDRAAVTDFAVTIGGRRIVGILKERQAARDSYDAAIEAGQRAAIVEEERPDIFTTRVGNLAPGEDAVVELTLAGRLPYEDGEATFRFPLVVAPRYVPGELLEGESVGAGTVGDTDAVPDASRIRPPVLLPGVANPVKLSLSATIDPGGLDVADLRSSLHAVTTSGALPGAVTLEIQPGERLDRDFILRFRVGGDRLAASVSCVVAPDTDGTGEGTFVVTVVPPLVEADGHRAEPRDVVVALDRSGSMGGWKMVAARRAAARIIDSLTSADRFGVLAFDHVVERPAVPSGGLVEATDRNRYLAVEWLARLEARGGTELLPALTQALTALPPSERGRARTCVLVTDGQVGNEDQLVNAVANHPGIRLFTVGIDRAVNAGLLRRLAAIGGGHCDLVESEDRLDEVMAAVHRRIGHPVLEAVSVQLPAMNVLAGTTTPDGPVDVFPGVPLVVAGRYRGEAAGGAVVTSPGPALEAPVNLVNGDATAAVWARAHLRDLEDRYASAAPGADLDHMAAHIVAVSLRHRVLCRFTAFVAVDDSGDPVAGQPHQIVQPVELPSGWSLQPVGSAIPRMDQPLSATGWTAAAMPAPMGAHAPSMRSPRAGAFQSPSEGAPPPSGRRFSQGPLPPAARTIGLDGYADRFHDLLGTLGALTPVADLMTDVAADVRALAGDLRSVHGPEDVVAALEAVAQALDVGDMDAVSARTEELRQLLAKLDDLAGKGGRRSWWRR
jgi:Ca-activated chloride channel homolog